jgi:hypothetical protein
VEPGPQATSVAPSATMSSIRLTIVVYPC